MRAVSRMWSAARRPDENYRRVTGGTLGGASALLDGACGCHCGGAEWAWSLGGTYGFNPMADRDTGSGQAGRFTVSWCIRCGSMEFLLPCTGNCRDRGLRYVLSRCCLRALSSARVERPFERIDEALVQLPFMLG